MRSVPHRHSWQLCIAQIQDGALLTRTPAVSALIFLSPLQQTAQANATFVQHALALLLSTVPSSEDNVFVCLLAAHVSRHQLVPLHLQVPMPLQHHQDIRDQKLEMLSFPGGINDVLGMAQHAVRQPEHCHYLYHFLHVPFQR